MNKSREKQAQARTDFESNPSVDKGCVCIIAPKECYSGCRYFQ